MLGAEGLFFKVFFKPQFALRKDFDAAGVTIWSDGVLGVYITPILQSLHFLFLTHKAEASLIAYYDLKKTDEE